MLLPKDGTGAKVVLTELDGGWGFGLGLRVVVVVGLACATGPSSGFGGVAGGLAHSGYKSKY